MSYYGLIKGQLAWKDVLPSSGGRKKRQLDKPKLPLLSKKITDKMEATFKREEGKERARRKKELKAEKAEFSAYRKARKEDKRIAVMEATLAVMEASPTRYQEWIAAHARLNEIKNSDPLNTDLY